MARLDFQLAWFGCSVLLLTGGRAGACRPCWRRDPSQPLHRRRVRCDHDGPNRRVEGGRTLLHGDRQRVRYRGRGLPVSLHALQGNLRTNVSFFILTFSPYFCTSTTGARQSPGLTKVFWVRGVGVTEVALMLWAGENFKTFQTFLFLAWRLLFSLRPCGYCNCNSFREKFQDTASRLPSMIWHYCRRPCECIAAKCRVCFYVFQPNSYT